MSSLIDRVVSLYPSRRDRQALELVSCDPLAELRKTPPRALRAAVEHVREVRERINAAERDGKLMSPEFAKTMPAAWQTAVELHRKNSVAAASHVGIEAQRLLIDPAVLRRAVDALETAVAAELDAFEKALATLKGRYGIAIRTTPEILRPFEQLAWTVANVRNLLDTAVDGFGDTRLANAASELVSAAG